MTTAQLREVDSGVIQTPDARAGHVTEGDLVGGRYRLEELVGIGGMSRVFRATDELLGRTVAVKHFSAASGNEADRLRRDSETRLLASLSHPSLVTLYDADALPDGSGYLAMEYVGGGTLADRIGRGPMAPHDVARVALDLAEALHVVHTAGVIHRDIKPPNVLLREMVGRPFQAMLADFGIAYLMDSARLTTPGMAVGTAAYFSPEQARGAQPSPASDIYALGLVLIEALTGVRAYPQTTPIEAAIARLHAPPVVPSGFGYGWRSLLTAMTATDPAERPTAQQVAERVSALSVDDVAADATQAAVPVAAAMAVAAPVAAEEAQTTRIVPIADVSPRLRDRTSRHRRRMVATRILAGTAGVAAIGLGLWAAGAEIGSAPVDRVAVPHVEVAETDVAEPTAPEPVQPVQPAVVTTEQTQTEQAPEPAAENQGPGSSGRGDGASSGPGKSDETHGNGKGKGTGSGKPDHGHGGG